MYDEHEDLLTWEYKFMMNKSMVLDFFFCLHEKMCYTSSYDDQKLHFLVKLKWKKVYIYYHINKCFMTIVLKYKVKQSIAEY